MCWQCASTAAAGLLILAACYVVDRGATALLVWRSKRVVAQRRKKGQVSR